MLLNYHIDGGDFVNAGKASSGVKRFLKQLAIPAPLIKRVVVALYEAEVNVAAHAYEGDINVEVDPETDSVRIMVDDRGPGIEDIELAMKAGFSTASKEVREMGFGAGMGLPNIKRNSDRFKIESTPGQGTRVEIVNKLKV